MVRENLRQKEKMNTDKNWFACEITVAAEASEAIEFGLNELDALGTEINNLGKAPTETLTVVGYFNEPPNEKDLRNQLNEALRVYGFAPDAIRETALRRVENLDWLFEWKKHWKPTETNKFIVAPSWEKLETAEKIIVWIDPQMAFGTGTHETTRLCLQAIEENYERGESFLDVGTGTGILAIAAAKLNSRFQIADSRFLAFDTDADSVDIARRNAESNDVENIEFFLGSLSHETPEFDFVCANITLDMILPILPMLIAKAKRFLVLSGILKEQETSITAELNKLQIGNFKIETRGEWISVSIFF